MHAKGGLISMTLMTAFACLVLSRASAQPQRSHEVLEAQDNGLRNPPIEIGNRVPGTDIPEWTREKQKKEILQAKLANSKKDAAELAALARQLREELNKPDFKTLSPDCVARLDKIEKLARKIRDELKAY